MIVKLDFKNRFSKEVEMHVQKNGGDYMDAILELCEKHEIEPEVSGKYLSKPIIEKLQIEASDRNLIKQKKSGKLPF